MGRDTEMIDDSNRLLFLKSMSKFDKSNEKSQTTPNFPYCNILSNVELVCLNALLMLLFDSFRNEEINDPFSNRNSVVLSVHATSCVRNVPQCHCYLHPLVSIFVKRFVFIKSRDIPRFPVMLSLISSRKEGPILVSTRPEKPQSGRFYGVNVTMRQHGGPTDGQTNRETDGESVSLKFFVAHAKELYQKKLFQLAS